MLMSGLSAQEKVGGKPLIVTIRFDPLHQLSLMETLEPKEVLRCRLMEQDREGS